MNNNLDQKTQLLKEFIEICQKNNLWYSADNLTLLSITTGHDFCAYSEYYEVIMKLDSYEKLKKLFPNKVLDNTTDSGYRSLQIKFLNDTKNIYETNVFINISLLVPTTAKKVSKFFSLKNKIRSLVSYNTSLKYTTIISKKIAKFFSYALLPLYKKITYKEALNKIYDEEFEGYIVFSDLQKSLAKKWLKNTSNTILVFNYKDLKINALNEYKDYLKANYGKDLNKVKIPNYKYSYINVIDQEKKKEQQE